MNILIVSQNYSPEIGAAPSRLAHMAEGLQRSGANVSVLTALPNYPKGRIFEGYRGCVALNEVINNINVYRYWTFASVSKKPIPRVLNMFALAFTLWMFAFRFRKIRSLDKVIIQTPSLPIACSAMILFKFIYRKEIILNVSDLWPLTGVELGAMHLQSRSYKFMSKMEDFLYKHSDIIQGQSQEIIDYIKDRQPNKRYFLYRNVQPKTEKCRVRIEDRASLKIAYAGLLGVAQDILGLVKTIDFKALGAEFHIYGGGNQVLQIQEYIANNDVSVFYHGYIDKKDMANTMKRYHTSIVPLTVRILGAVPSKIFDLISMNIPILYCGGGEGADIIQRYKIGLVSEPSDYVSLTTNIKQMKEMSKDEYMSMVNNCVEASLSDFSFEQQMGKYYQLLSE